MPYFPHVPNKVVFHHYGFPEDEPRRHMMLFFEGAGSIRAIQKDDIKCSGLIDIRFHYVIVPNGDVYECRPTQYMGRHVRSYDNGSIGVMVWGNFNVEEPTNEMKESILKLLIHLKEKHMTLDLPGGIFGHSCKNLTTCPGHNLARFLLKLKGGHL